MPETGDVQAFEELVAQATSAPIAGWDFSWLSDRSTAGKLPWSYNRLVSRRAKTADAMLDMGTGGGERLSAISPRPPRTVATEAWPPNVPLAAARLRPLGIPVIWDEGARDNTDHVSAGAGRMPFRTAAFPLIINRHEAFQAIEVSRVLSPGGTFVTQQVDFHSCDDLYELLGLDVPQQAESWLPVARRQLIDAGLKIHLAVRGEERHQLNDVAAVIYYLRLVSWAIPEFSLDSCMARLRDAHKRPGAWPVTLRQRRFLLVAGKQL
jgi:hypothetical protein